MSILDHPIPGGDDRCIVCGGPQGSSPVHDCYDYLSAYDDLATATYDPFADNEDYERIEEQD